MLELWPGTKNAIGPAIENGFYYDFDFGEEKISEADLPKIEKLMRKILAGWGSFKSKKMIPDEAKKTFKHNPYKLELIEELSKAGEQITLNDPGGFLDLCRGGHVDDPPREMKHFKLLSVAGAYWRGDEKNKMLTRIYGTAFASQEELKKHLWQLEEAKKRDHRKLGRELDLFSISEAVGKGLVLWHPKGNIIKEELENWAKKTESDWGYQRVTTPNITKAGLYHTSGHLPYYKDDMYPSMKLEDGEEYYLKPMNCPHHHMIYAAKPRSYKDLPLRLAEYGGCYRYEASGELMGLMRVRGLDMNDAHIYCTYDQAVDEFVEVMKLHEFYYKTLGIDHYHLELALRDPKNKKKYHGNEKMWEKAEKMMREAVGRLDIEMVEEEGSAAFYGPKIDFIIHSSIGREFAISTNQIDLFMGTRFGLKFTDANGGSQVPAIIHRAPLGSHERFIGFLIEHYGGAFPTWLSPVQAAILPVSKKSISYAKSVEKELKDNGVRTFLDSSDTMIGKKIRNAEGQKLPYMLIVGEKEEKSKTAAVRTRGRVDLGEMSLEKFSNGIRQEIEDKSLKLMA